VKGKNNMEETFQDLEPNLVDTSGPRTAKTPAYRPCSVPAGGMSTQLHPRLRKQKETICETSKISKLTSGIARFKRRNSFAVKLHDF